MKCQGKIREKSGNFEMDDKGQTCNLPSQVKQGGIIYVLCVAEVRYGYFFSDVDISRVDFFQLVWFMSV